MIVNALATTTPTVSSSVSDVMTIVNSIMTTIEGNSLLFMFAVAGLIGIAVGVVRSLIGRY